MKEMNDIEKGERKEEDFHELLEQSLAEGQRRFRPGEKHAVQIVKISHEWVFVDLGGKTEGIIDRSEFVGEDGSLGIREGDTVEAEDAEEAEERINRYRLAVMILGTVSAVAVLIIVLMLAL